VTTIDEIDEAMMALPRSPVTPEDIAARADLAMKRHAAIDAAREAEARRVAADKKASWPFPLVNVPDGIDSVQITNNRIVHAEVIGGRRVMRLTPGEAKRLSIHNCKWLELNADLDWSAYII
jgi:hypothetical protein